MKIQLFTPQVSAGLRIKLEKYLAAALSDVELAKSNIFKYGQSTNYETEITGNTPQQHLFYLRSAYHIWLAMHAADRYIVLQKFKNLWRQRLGVMSPEQINIAFCYVFVHHLAIVLSKAAALPR